MDETKQSTFPSSELKPDLFLKYAPHQDAYDLNCLHPHGRYNIRNRTLFFSSYQNACTNELFHFAEKCLDEGPVRVDVDLKLEVADEKSKRHLHTDTDILKVMIAVQRAITTLTRDSPESVNLEEALQCVVLKKEPYFSSPDAEGKIHLKHGFHLHFPKVVVETLHLKLILQHARNLFQQDEEQEEEKKVFDIDIGAADNAWLLYGSSKGPGFEPYLVDKVYDARAEEMSLEDFAKTMIVEMQLIDSLALKRIQLELPKDWPIILSINVNDRAKYYKRRMTKEALGGKTPTENVRVAERQDVSPEYAEEMLKKLKVMLKFITTTTVGYTHCIKIVGNAIHNETGGSGEGLKLWQWWKKNVLEEPYEDDYNAWDAFKSDPPVYYERISLLAKKCSPDAYKAAFQRNYIAAIKNAIYEGEREVAHLAKLHYEDIYVCTNASTEDGYFFRDMLWKFEPKAVNLKREFLDVTKDKEKVDLSKGLGKTLQQTLLAFERECDLKTLEDDEDDLDDRFEPPPSKRKSKRSKKKKVEEEDEEDLEESAMSKEEHHKLKSIELRKKLSSKRYIYSIVNLLSILSWKHDFQEELDSKPNLIAFKNGVINLHKRDEQGNFILERGQPDHMLSMCVDADYKEFEETDPKVIFVRKFFAQVFPNPKVAEYVMGCLALCFYGQNTEKIVCFFTGSGNNAKSLLNKLMASLLKQLSTEININVFNQQKNAENATPQLAKIAKRRLVQVAEATATITTNLLKQLTGDDKVSARKLHNDDNSFDPMCQIHFSSNALPHLVDFCDAMKERVRVIEFPSKFVTKEQFDSYTPEEREENHIFLQDPFIRSKIDMDAFAFVLMKTFKEQFGNRIVPDEVRLSTADFSSENNMYEHFISRHITKSGAEHRVFLDDAFNQFAKFVRANSSPMTLNKQSFKVQMNILLKTTLECSPTNKRQQWWPRHNLSTV